MTTYSAPTPEPIDLSALPYSASMRPNEDVPGGYVVTADSADTTLARLRSAVAAAPRLDRTRAPGGEARAALHSRAAGATTVEDLRSVLVAMLAPNWPADTPAATGTGTPPRP